MLKLLALLFLLSPMVHAEVMNPDGYIGGWSLGVDLSLSPPQDTHAVSNSKYFYGSQTDKAYEDITSRSANYGLALSVKIPKNEFFSFGAGVNLIGSTASTNSDGTYTTQSGNSTTSTSKINFDGTLIYSINVGLRYYFKP